MNTRNVFKTTLLLAGLVLANGAQAGLLGGSAGGALGGALGGNFGPGSQGIGGTMNGAFGSDFDNNMDAGRRLRDTSSQVVNRTDSAAQSARKHGKDVAASGANDVTGTVNGLTASGNAAGSAAGSASGKSTGNLAGDVAGNAAGSGTGDAMLPSMSDTKPSSSPAPSKPAPSKPAPSKPGPSSPPQPQPQLTTGAGGNAAGSVQRTDDRHVHAEASDGYQASASASH